MASPLSSWPFKTLGNFKYLLLGPLVADVGYSWIHEGGRSFQEKDNWCLYILSLYLLRCLVYELWNSFSNMLFLYRTRRIVQDGVDFQQIDMESDWDNFLILQTALCSLVCFIFPSAVISLPLFNSRGLFYCLLAHVFISEPAYYWAHRHFHTSHLFRHYHSLHHASRVPQPFTAGNATPLEHLVLTVANWAPVVAVTLTGNGSCVLVFGYVAAFDFLRCLGHCNVEVMSHRVFEFLPVLKYLIYTPTYHSLHHTEMETNFCLFMPVFDAVGKTLNPKSWELHKKISSSSDRYGQVPDFVFLAHIVDVTQAMHVSFAFRSYAAKPFATKLILLPLWPAALCILLIMWPLSKPFLFNFYSLRHGLHQVWAVPRFGFQYFLPFARNGINKHIEKAILRADKLGVKVISLAALNKNEVLNGGGTFFVAKHPGLKVKVVHGNTLTAAVILNNIDLDSAAAGDVFLTGATSKLGRAIALYLCRRKIRVLMLTLSTERFYAIQKEADVDHRNYLVQVTKYQAARNCKTWIVGKWITPREQSWAPSGTQFHQFVVPPILPFRRDCVYSDLASMRLPQDVQGLGFCEYTMERGVVHACHVGGVVHLLEGWSHHEVGAIDVERIDLVWKAALKHGMQPVSSFQKRSS